VKQTIEGIKNSFNYEAVGWRMAERAAAENLQTGDRLDVAFTVAMNFHPEFGGLELCLQDFKKSAPAPISVYS
jgi:hypothetical protein